MHRILYILTLFIVSITTATAGNYKPWWQWAIVDNNYPNTAQDADHVLAAKGGKVFWGTMLNRKLPAGGFTYGDYRLSEYDTSGVPLTGAYIGGKVHLLDAQVDGAGNWYILGSFFDSLVLPNGAAMLRAGVANDPDHFMMRLNAGSLTMSWVKMVGGSSNAVANTFNITNNNIYIPVDSGNETQVRFMNIVTGNYTTLFTQSGYSKSSSIAVEAATGAIYLAGSCVQAGLNFNGVNQPMVTGNLLPSYLVKYNSNGTHSWHYWLKETKCVHRKVSLAPGGIVYYSGTLYDSVTFGGLLLHPPAWGADFIAARLDTAGHAIWVRQIDSVGGGNATLTNPYNAVVTPDSALVIFAQSHNYVDWRDTVSTNTNGAFSATLVSFRKDGHTLWARNIMAEVTTNQHIATDGSDAIWITGNGYSSVGFLGFDTMHVPINFQVYTPYLAKLKLTPAPVSNSVGNTTLNAPVQIYPNPASTVLRFSFGQSGTEAVISLRTMDSREVNRLPVSSADKTAVMDISKLPRGMYMIVISNSKATNATTILLL